MDYRRLEGKGAVITGAGGGIAISTALSFAAEGAAVSLTDIDQAGVEKAVSKVVSKGGKASADAFMGGIDILVTCAGGYKAYAGFEDISEDDWDRVIDVNLKSVYLCCKAVLPYMKTRGWGRIINLGSLAGRSTSAGTSPAHYASAKAAVSMMTQYLAKDIGPYNITANTIAPGTTMTDRVKKMLTSEKKEMFTKASPLGRLAQPEEISDVITFMASDESRYITGATIDVNGGRLMLV